MALEKYIDKSEDEKSTIVSDTKDLLKGIDVTEDAEAAVWNFFTKLDTYEEKDKLQLLHKVLEEGEIRIGNGGAKSFKEVADDFSVHVKQDGESSWKIIEKEELPEGKKYLKQFLNERNSSLAYLIQRTANFIKYEAARGYGATASTVEAIGEDKILGNQTKRALSGLKSWIENKNILNFDEEKTYTEDDIKAMKFVSKNFLTSLQAKNADLFWKFWKEEDGKFVAAEGYRFVQEWSNNYAVVEKGAEDEVETNTGEVETSTDEVNEVADRGDAPEDLKADRFLTEDVLEAVKTTNPELDYFGEKKPILVAVGTMTTYSPYGGATTVTSNDYEKLTFSVGGKSTSIKVVDLLDANAEFDMNKWNRKLWEQKEILVNKLIAQSVVEKIREKKYTQKDIFPEPLPVSKRKSLVNKYFSRFNNNLLEIDKGISNANEQTWELKIRLNDSWLDEKYNKPEYNEMLRIQPAQYKEFLANGKFEEEGEKAFKKYLQEVVLNIVDTYWDKI